MLDPALRDQLRGHLELLRESVVIATTLDDSPTSTEIAELVEEIAALSERVRVEARDDAERRPSFRIEREGTDIGVAFSAVPLGHEFTSLVLALLHVGGHPPQIDEPLADAVRGITEPHHFETFVSLSCQICPDVVQALNVMSVLNPNISHVTIDGAIHPAEAEERGVTSVPAVFKDGELFEFGRLTIPEIVGRLDSGAAEAEAVRLDGLDSFDVLVVGGGPAGASAAIYTARKGLRTGIVAERFGGQLLDTVDIENYASVPHTEGPKMAAALEAQVRENGVEIITGQRAAALEPATEPGGQIGVLLESGARLTGRSVVLATGARWRRLEVPGEEDHLNKGVAFCAHCDGPLYKGKRVAVVGGGNSGVEAAIDLAGIASHVTVVEFMPELIADDVLVQRLRSLPNVDIVTEAATQEIEGTGEGVTALRYLDRTSEEDHRVELEGIFVQIGLVPNTDWLKGTVDLTERGEIIIDEGGRTSVPGVTAGGDCTTTPYKQIVVAAGGGAAAALSAFDHLVRSGVPESA